MIKKERLSQDGAIYMVGAQVAEDGSAACVARAQGRDAAALVPEGMDLGATGMVEFAGGDTNASGLLLQNFATNPVCTTSFPHPDGAVRLSHDPLRGVHCYVDIGAGLNDINGERDGAGYYFGADWSYHLVMSNGVQAPAAKRPSTKSWPAPGAVNERSPLRWLVYNPYVTIAN
jgi:hypothetical protein